MGRIEHTLLDREFSVRPNRPKTIARSPTIPQKVTNVSIHAKGPELSWTESSDPMIEAGTTSTGKVVVLLEVSTVHAPPGVLMVAPLEPPYF